MHVLKTYILISCIKLPIRPLLLAYFRGSKTMNEKSVLKNFNQISKTHSCIGSTIRAA